VQWGPAIIIPNIHVYVVPKKQLYDIDASPSQRCVQWSTEFASDVQILWTL
jgi:hypothetical protein